MTLNKSDVLVISSIMLVYTSSYAIYSTFAPFYPLEALDKGSNNIINGIVFASYHIVTFLMSPIFGKFSIKIGLFFVLVSGSFLEAIAQIFIGYLPAMPNTWSFILFSFLLRIATAIGGTASRITSISILCSVFPDRTSFMIGLIEFSCGLGLVISPALGSLLYLIDGFKLPFIVIGSFTCLVVIFILSTFPRQRLNFSNADFGKISLWDVLKVPGVIISNICILVLQTCVTYCESTLSLRIDQLANHKLSRSIIATFFLLDPIFYALSAPVSGFIIQKAMPTQYLIIVGYILISLVFIMLGPVPFMKCLFTPTELSTGVSLAVFGFAQGFVMVPVIGNMEYYAIRSGIENGPSLKNMLSSFYICSNGIGNAIGPIFGGAFMEYFSFEWACFVLVLLSSTQTIFFLVFVVSAKINDKVNNAREDYENLI